MSSLGIGNEVRAALRRVPLRDAGGSVKGIGGINTDLDKDKLRIVTTDKEVTVCESRKVCNLGLNADNNKRFVAAAKLEWGIEGNDSRFEWTSGRDYPTYSEWFEEWIPVKQAAQ